MAGRPGAGRRGGRHPASARLLERLGRRREAHLRQDELVTGARTDELASAVLAGEWNAGVDRER